MFVKIQSLGLLVFITLAFLSSSNALGQSDELVAHLLVDQNQVPMTYRLKDVVLRVHPAKFELTNDQVVQLRELRSEYRDRVAELLSGTGDTLAGKTRISRAETDAISAAMDRKGVREKKEALMTEIETRAKSMLLPHQLELVYAELAKERLIRYGLRGLLSCEELGANFEQDATEIVKTVSDKRSEIQSQIDELAKQYRELTIQYRKEILSLQRQQLEEALVRLGDDGEKLRAIIERVEESTNRR